MYQLSMSQGYTGIERHTPKNLAVAVVLGEAINSTNTHVSAKQFFKILHIQFIIEKLITGFHTCSDLQHGICIKFKIERTPQYVNGLLNEVMTYYKYNNGTNYCVEKYNLLLDKIRKDQERLNDNYNVEFEKDERYNCWFFVFPEEIEEKPPLKLVPQLKPAPTRDSLVAKPELRAVTPINQVISKVQNDEFNDPSYVYFKHLFDEVKAAQTDNTVEFFFPLLNNYLSYSMDDLMGTLEKFEETTLLQFTIIPQQSQYQCICQLLNILSE
jgi:hypothetical protein